MSKFYYELGEQATIGAVLLNPQTMEIIEENKVDIGTFYADHHKKIFESMQTVYRKNDNVDLITVVENLREKGELESVGGVNYITSLTTIVPTTSAVTNYINSLKELEEKRNVVQSAYKLIQDIEQGETVNTSLDIFERSTEQKEQVTESMELSNIMFKMFEDLESGKKVDKINTGIGIIDKCTNGIADGELITICAKSGVGKTALATRIGINMFKEGQKVLIISREMTKEQLAERFILSATGIDKYKYENRDFSETDWQRIVNAMEMFSTDKIIIDDESSTIFDIQRQVKKYKPDVLIVDYLQLLTPINSKDSRERQVADLSRELKLMTLKFKMKIIQLSQMAEKGTGNYRPSGESYIRESRAPYHDSNLVVYVHQVTEESELERAYNNTPFKERGNFEGFANSVRNQAENGLKFIELIVDKNRNGSVGSNYMWFSGQSLGYFPIV